MPIVYLHRRNSNNEVFYVGIGKNNVRAYEKIGRNKHWHNIANKGYSVEITHQNIIREEAVSIEKYLIFFYGRMDKKNGSLCNLTDGGDGCLGGVFTEERKLKISKARKGKKMNLTPEQIKKLSERAKEFLNRPENIEKNRERGKLRLSSEEARKEMSEKLKIVMNKEDVKKKTSIASKKSWENSERREAQRLKRLGTKASEETKQKMSLSRTGEKNHNFGRVFDEETRKRMSESHKGKAARFVSQEERLILSQKMKEIWAKRRLEKSCKR